MVSISCVVLVTIPLCLSYCVCLFVLKCLQPEQQTETHNEGVHVAEVEQVVGEKVSSYALHVLQCVGDNPFMNALPLGFDTFEMLSPNTKWRWSPRPYPPHK